jgi:hypothetical protein
VTTSLGHGETTITETRAIPNFPTASVLLLTLHDILWRLVEPSTPALGNHSCLHDSFPEPPHHGISRFVLSNDNLKLHSVNINTKTLKIAVS